MVGNATSHELVKARLNLFAVLPNLEDLVRFDEVASENARAWDVEIQFSIMGGPAATVVFKNGECRHICGREKARIKLLFLSAKHLNDMFQGKATPIPLKGLSRLGFLKNDFARLTERLAYYLRWTGANGGDESRLQMATRLKLATAACAARELAEHDSAGRLIAGNIPDGSLQIEVTHDGPAVSVTFKGGRAQVRKGRCEAPTAQMIFQDCHAADRLLSGQADSFQEIAQGYLALRGRIPLIDNFGLLLDRLPHYGLG